MKHFILLQLFLFSLNLILSGQSEKTYLRELGLIDSLHSEILGETRKIYIDYPIDYNPNSNKKYPVTYVLDGEFIFPTVVEFQNYYSGGYTPEMILVGVSNLQNRQRDLTPTVWEDGPTWLGEHGKASVFLDFFEKELIPYVEENYPVTNYRTLVGHSYGGLFTVYTMLIQPQLFHNYLAIDPSMDWDNQFLLTKAKEILPHTDYTNRSLFMSLGGQLQMADSNVTIDNVMEDTTANTLFPRSNIEFSNLVKSNASNGLKLFWEFYPDDLHGTVPLPSIIDGMKGMFKWYQWEKTDRMNASDSSIEELKEIFNYRAEKLESHFGYYYPPYPEEVLNTMGYMNMDMEQIDKSKMYFEVAIKYYPDSPNVYDSMADFYEAQGDIPQAIKYVTKAMELSDSDYFKTRLEKLKSK